MTDHNNIADRLEAMNKRYIRKPECKATLAEAIAALRAMASEAA